MGSNGSGQHTGQMKLLHHTDTKGKDAMLMTKSNVAEVAAGSIITGPAVMMTGTGTEDTMAATSTRAGGGDARGATVQVTGTCHRGTSRSHTHGRAGTVITLSSSS